MKDYLIRCARVDDVDFIVETIIEAQKGSSNKSLFSLVYDLTVKESFNYIKIMLLEDVIGCDFSLSSFLVLERNNKVVASVNGWVEGSQGISSSILKANLFNYILPKKHLKKEQSLNKLFRELQFEFLNDTIQIGYAYVEKNSRGNNFIGILLNERINSLKSKNQKTTEVYIRLHGNNIKGLIAYKKIKFEIDSIKESLNKEILNYLPSNKSIQMKKKI